MNIDIHNPPSRQEKSAFLEYMIAVMKAANEGRDVQIRGKDNRDMSFSRPIKLEDLSWNWEELDYRIDPSSRPSDLEFSESNYPKIGKYVIAKNDLSCDIFGVGEGEGPRKGQIYIVDNVSTFPYNIRVTAYPGVSWSWGCWRFADRQEIEDYNKTKLVFKAGDYIAPGHNPDKLTNEQVGIKNGWRLLDEDEIKRRDATIAIQIWWRSRFISGSYSGTNYPTTYRTKLSRKNLAKLEPKKIKRMPLGPTDFPALVWMRNRGHSNAWNVTYIDGGGINVVNKISCDGIAQVSSFSYEDLMIKDIEYSSDRINWRPCYREVEEI